MVDVSVLIAQGRELLSQQQPQQALEILQPVAEQNVDNVIFLQFYGELLLENSLVEQAYEVFTRACELDQEAKLGTEKFFYLGQIIGGEDGISLLNVGLNRLQEQLVEAEGAASTTDTSSTEATASVSSSVSGYKKQLAKGIFASIEIWMTDLCMSTEAELKCDELIQFAISIDNTNAEAWSTLASIRISQQKPQEAKEAILKSWDLFQQAQKGDEEEEEDIIELIEPLLTLCKFAIELEMFEIARDIANCVQNLNEHSLESYYLESFANYLMLKKSQYGGPQQQQENIGEIYPNLPPLNLVDIDEMTKQTILSIRICLTNAIKISKLDEFDNQDDQDLQELLQQIRQILDECGGIVKKKEMAKLQQEQQQQEQEQSMKDDEADWENEIESD